MEYHPLGPEYCDPPLSQTELSGLFDVLARALITNGSYETARGVATPAGSPGVLYFKLAVPETVVHDIFYRHDDAVELDAAATYLSYMTPHSHDETGTEEPESNVYLNIAGRFKETDIVFNTSYLITRDDYAPRTYYGEVTHEYANGERVIDDVVATLGFEDADKLRRLLDNLLK